MFHWLANGIEKNQIVKAHVKKPWTEVVYAVNEVSFLKLYPEWRYTWEQISCLSEDFKVTG